MRNGTVFGLAGQEDEPKVPSLLPQPGSDSPISSASTQKILYSSILTAHRRIVGIGNVKSASLECSIYYRSLLYI